MTTAPLPDEERQPRTEAGRRLFTDVDPGDMWESDGVTWADIIAVEEEAARGLDVDRLREAIGNIQIWAEDIPSQIAAEYAAIPAATDEGLRADGGEPERFHKMEIAQAIADERHRWSQWAKDIGYPFDFTNSDGIPEDDMLEAIARRWMDDGWESFDEARWDVFEEVLGREQTATRLPALAAQEEERP